MPEQLIFKKTIFGSYLIMMSSAAMTLSGCQTLPPSATEHQQQSTVHSTPPPLSPTSEHPIQDTQSVENTDISSEPPLLASHENNTSSSPHLPSNSTASSPSVSAEDHNAKPAPNPPRLILPKQPKSAVQLKNGQSIPAYQKLMNDYIAYLRQNNLLAAEHALTQAQRIAPQSSDVYRELSRLANLKGQYLSAEAFARKGLMYALSNVQRKLLWQQIQFSAAKRNDAALIQQANLALIQLK